MVKAKAICSELAELVLGRDSEAGGGLRKLPSGAEGSSGRLMGAGDLMGAGHGCQKKGHPGDWSGGAFSD